jgi:hypothetical protein
MMMRSPGEVVFSWDGFPHPGRHQPQGGHEDQAFARIAFVEQEQTVGRRNTAFVAAVPHPFDDAVQQAPRMKVGFKVPLVVPLPTQYPYMPMISFEPFPVPMGSR